MLTDRVDDEVLRANPRLKAVANYAVGFNNIDLAAATRRGIPVSNTPDVLTDATADTAWALLLAAARRVPEGDRYARSGEWTGWSPGLMLGADVSASHARVPRPGPDGIVFRERFSPYRWIPAFVLGIVGVVAWESAVRKTGAVEAAWRWGVVAGCAALAAGFLFVVVEKDLDRGSGVATARVGWLGLRLA